MVTVLDPITVEREAITSEPAYVAAYLQQMLGQKIVAYSTGLKDPKMVGAWARGKATPHPLALLRLRCAYQAARIVVSAYGEETAKAWFFGSNHLLDDEAPAYVLRHARDPGELRLIVPAARAFAGSIG
jgi:hypothetical protein